MKSLTNESDQSLDTKNSVVTPTTLDLDHVCQVHDDVIKAAKDIFMQRKRNVTQGFGKSPDNSNHRQYEEDAANFPSVPKE